MCSVSLGHTDGVVAPYNSLNRFEQLARLIAPSSTLLRTWGLKGGVSAQVTALEIDQPDGRVRKLVVRQYGATDLLHNPHVADDEYRLLTLLHAAGLAVPTPLYLDHTAAIFPAPCLVIEYIEGTTDVTPIDPANAIDQLAAQLAMIHRLDCRVSDFSFLSTQEERIAAKLRDRPAQLDATLDERRIRDTLQTNWPMRRLNRPVLLHGDFWSGNTLWHAGKLVGVIDWEDAAVGDPLADLGNSRLEILWAFGADAMSRFTQHYESLMGVDMTDLPYWDLCATLRPIGALSGWELDVADENRMRGQLRFFIEQAYASIKASSAGM